MNAYDKLSALCEDAPLGATTVTVEIADLLGLLEEFMPLGAAPAKRAKKKPAPAGVELPAWLPLEAWREFLAMRVKIKKPATDYAQKLLIKKLAAFYANDMDVSVILNQSIMNGWQDVYAPKIEARGYGYDTGPRKPFGARQPVQDVNAANNAVALALLDQQAGDNARVINE